MTMLFHPRTDGSLACSEGWAVRFVGPDLLEYSDGESSCLINVDRMMRDRTRRIYATESSSDYFPGLRERLKAAAGHFKGAFEVV
jgi:hypothetical protein